MRLIYGKYTGVRARRVLVFDTSRRQSFRGGWRRPVTRALPRAGAETSTRPANRTRLKYGKIGAERARHRR